MKHRGHFQNDINYEWISVTDALTSLASRVLGEPEEAVFASYFICSLSFRHVVMVKCRNQNPNVGRRIQNLIT